MIVSYHILITRDALPNSPQGPASLKRLDVDHLLSHKRLGGAQPGPALLVSEFPCRSGPAVQHTQCVCGTMSL